MLVRGAKNVCFMCLRADLALVFLLGQCHSDMIVQNVQMESHLVAPSWEKGRVRVFMLSRSLGRPWYRRRLTSGSGVNFKGTEEDP